MGLTKDILNDIPQNNYQNITQNSQNSNTTNSTGKKVQHLTQDNKAVK